MLLVAVALLWVLAALSCGGGRRPPIRPETGQEQPTPPPPPPEKPEEVAQYERDLAERMQPWPSAETGALKGTLAVTGLTILDRQTLNPASPTDRLTEVITRIVDPEDNIGSITMPDNGGDFIHPDLVPSEFSRLQVSFVVAEDLDADGSGSDTVNVELPVSIAAGVQTTVELNLEGATVEQFSDAPLAPEYGAPAGVPVKASYHILDSRGERDTLLGLMYDLRQLVVDRNANGEFDAADALDSDSDRNAFGDSGESDFLAGARMSPPVELSFEALVTGVGDGSLQVIDTHTHRARVVEVNLQLSVLCGLDGLPLPLTTALVGRTVFIDALSLPQDRLLALLVLVLGE